MGQVISFERYQPIARYDALPWTHARIEEAPLRVGPWTAIETIALSPVDANPATPQLRNLTTEDATELPGLFYRIAFIDANADESAPTDPVQNGATNVYVSIDELLIWLELEGTEGMDVDLALAVEAASRACDAYRGKVFFTNTRTRYYSARQGSQRIPIHDLAELTSLTLDFDNDGVFETTWTEGTHFYLDPEGATADGYPFSSLELLRAGRRFPRYDRSIKLEGSFGWPTIPANVHQAAKILAARLFKRREIPFAILPVAAAEMVTAARLGRIDPDVAWLLDNIPGVSRGGLVSVQLR